ncbi:helix-turn-helix domain-containing protein [Pseudomonas sp. 5P_5.1_Bac1]|uniref:helix-turn-helix domain-containing protein n=1 Tax=Pseudomonas sp. 5P_5.1_Bac1 TaxID=2971616 RepID=UPI003965A9FE
MRSELKHALGKVLKSYRLKRNLSQESLGPSQAYISNLEQGRWSPSIDKIEQMSNAIGVHPASVILAGYLSLADSASADELLERIRGEIGELGL